MAVEFARTQAQPRPWGVGDLRPWYTTRAGDDGRPIGEIWYERPGKPAADPSLLLKLLLTNEPLSIQVHPDDAYAHSIGLPNGKTEAWYVLSAAAGAKVALGLNARTTPEQLRQAVHDGSISELVVWQEVAAHDVIFVPSGTIHSIGAGLVIAEIQQRSDATFRLFDHGRQRELHIENAIAVANTGPVEPQMQPHRLSDERALLVSNSHFVFERIALPPATAWSLEAERETWLLVHSGSATAGAFDVSIGDAIFAQSDRVEIHTGATGMGALVAYAGAGAVPNLLQRLRQPRSTDPKWPRDARAPPSLTQSQAALSNGRWET